MIKGKNKTGAVLILLLLLVATSCGKDTLFTGSSAMPGNIWRVAGIASFRFAVDDTLSNNDIHFTLRTGSAYPFRNIYLFVTTTAPDGKIMTDTLEYNLADEKGNRYGKGFGDVRELVLPYRTNVFFPVSGTYTVDIQHGMRMEDLRGVYDIGLRVETINKPE
ncbi:MAG: gliding motility lipoprotein GldH [Bacteroidales bacterium]|jgi:gliding motility-associated lipoprotein GldH|nr:gliding motility lipoprotein GldH [Bacteroidales bacterium]